MTAPAMKPRVTSLAPQFLVDDLERSIGYYEKLGFTFGESWEGFYAIGRIDGLELHLKRAPKSDDERRHRRDGTKDFCVEDPDGYIICFGGRPATG